MKVYVESCMLPGTLLETLLNERGDMTGSGQATIMEELHHKDPTLKCMKITCND